MREPARAEAVDLASNAFGHHLHREREVQSLRRVGDKVNQVFQNLPVANLIDSVENHEMLVFESLVDQREQKRVRIGAFAVHGRIVEHGKNMGPEMSRIVVAFVDVEPRNLHCGDRIPVD